MSVVNTLATPFLIAGLWSVSRATELTVTSSGEVHGYPWLPAWLAFGVAIALFAYFAARIDERRVALRLGSLERCAVLARGGAAGALRRHRCASGRARDVRLVRGGPSARSRRAGPRRARSRGATSCSSHGLLFDVGRGLFGTRGVRGQSLGTRRGRRSAAHPARMGRPSTTCARTCSGRTGSILLGTQLVIVVRAHHSDPDPDAPRPAAPSCFSLRCLREPNLLLAAAFTAVLVVQMHRDARGARRRGGFVGDARRLRVPLPRTRSKARRGLPADDRAALRSAPSFLLGWAAVPRGCIGALDDWAFSFAATIPGHRLTGGIESCRLRQTSFEVAAPIVAVLFVFALHGRSVCACAAAVSYTDWLMVAMAGFTLLYFAKFLSRADSGHSGPVVRRRRPAALLRRLSRNHVRRGAAGDAPPRSGRALVPAAPHAHRCPCSSSCWSPRPSRSTARFGRHRGNFRRRLPERSPRSPGIGYTRPGENDAGGAARPRGRAETRSWSPATPSSTSRTLRASSTTCSIERAEHAATTTSAYAIRRRTQIGSRRPAATRTRRPRSSLTSAGASSRASTAFPPGTGSPNAGAPLRRQRVPPRPLRARARRRWVRAHGAAATAGARADSDALLPPRVLRLGLRAELLHTGAGGVRDIREPAVPSTRAHGRQRADGVRGRRSRLMPPTTAGWRFALGDALARGRLRARGSAGVSCLTTAASSSSRRSTAAKRVRASEGRLVQPVARVPARHALLLDEHACRTSREIRLVRAQRRQPGSGLRASSV